MVSPGYAAKVVRSDQKEIWLNGNVSYLGSFNDAIVSFRIYDCAVENVLPCLKEVVRVWEDKDYEGLERGFSAGETKNLGYWNGRISSMKILPGYVVQATKVGTRTPKNFSNDVPDLSSSQFNFNDASISSIYIARP